MFLAYDKNQNDKLDKSQIKTYLADTLGRAGKLATDYDVKRFMDAVDINRDCLITKQELKTVLMILHPKSSS